MNPINNCQSTSRVYNAGGKTNKEVTKCPSRHGHRQCVCRARVSINTTDDTWGISEKNPPTPKPFTMMKTTSGAKLDEAGQMVSMLSAFTVNARTSEEIGPMKLPNIPNTNVRWQRPGVSDTNTTNHNKGDQIRTILRRLHFFASVP